jgi:hypothetical protein
MMTTTTTKETNWLPWVFLAVGIYFWNISEQKTVDPVVPPSPVDRIDINGTVKAVKAANVQALSDAFEDAAKQVESGKFKFARELLEYMQPLTKSAREQSNKPFDLMIGQIVPDELSGKEKQVADDLRKVAKAWLK